MFTKAILAVIGSLIATTSVLSADTPPDAIQFQMGDGTVVMLLNKVGDDNWVADIAGHKDFAFDPADTPPYTTEAMSVTFLAPPDTRPISSSEGALAPVAPSVVVSCGILAPTGVAKGGGTMSLTSVSPWLSPTVVAGATASCSDVPQ